MHRLRLIVLSLVGLTLIGCGPNLKAIDRQLDFGDTFVGVPATRSTAWVNHGGEAHIRKVVVSKSDAFEADASALIDDPELSKNERSGDVVVTFLPKRPGEYEAKLSLDSNGREEPVFLRGRGVYVMSSDAVSLSGAGLSWDAPLDHGSVPVIGGEGLRRVTITNNTGRRVTVRPYVGHGEKGFSVQDGSQTIRLRPGASAEVVTRFDPVAAGVFNDTLLFTVDGERARSGIALTGQGTK